MWLPLGGKPSKKVSFYIEYFISFNHSITQITSSVAFPKIETLGTLPDFLHAHQRGESDHLYPINILMLSIY